MEQNTRLALAAILAIVLVAPQARAQDAPTETTTTEPAPMLEPAQPTSEAEGPDDEDVATPEELPPQEQAREEPPPLEESPPDDFRNAWVQLGARVGVYIPGLVNRMDPHVVVGVEAGVLLPFIERRIAIIADLHYAPPGAGAQLSDPRIGDDGGSWTYRMTTEELFASLGLVFRFLPPGSFIVPYLGASGRLYFLRTTVEGDGAGAPFGQNTEQSMQGGFSVWAGGELRLGPGAVFVEAAFGWSDLPHTITGATSTSALAITLGYRFIL